MYPLTVMPYSYERTPNFCASDHDFPETPYRPGHNAGTACQIIGEYSTTASSFATGLLWPGKGGFDSLDEAGDRIDKYFADNPQGVVVVGYYTPRGRKRRGLPRTPRRMPSIRFGVERLYFPNAAYYDGGDVTVHRDRATVVCRCRGVNRAQTPHLTTVWERDS